MIGTISKRTFEGLCWYSWPVLESHGIRHGFTTRKGGASRGPFASLNFTSNQGDSRDRVMENWSRLESAARLSGGWGLVRQVHGSSVIRRMRGRPATDSRKNCTAADGVMTTNRRIAIGVLTADCLPLVLAARDTGMFSVIHAGWQGTLMGVAVRAVQELAAAGAVPGDMMAVLGPSIGSCCYQVGDEVYGAFEKNWRGRLRKAFRRTNPWHLDLQKANMLQLQNAGVRGDNIAAVALCTCCRRDLFFSHRRDGVRTGRMLAFATAAPHALPPPTRGT